jgi:hypothetical protein
VRRYSTRSAATERGCCQHFRTTPSLDAKRYIAPTFRLSFRAITILVLSRVSDLSMRTSSFVHGQLRVIFFAILVPHRSMLPTNQRRMPGSLMVQCMMTERFFFGTNTPRNTNVLKLRRLLRAASGTCRSPAS